MSNTIFCGHLLGADVRCNLLSEYLEGHTKSVLLIGGTCLSSGGHTIPGLGNENGVCTIWWELTGI